MKFVTVLLFAIISVSIHAQQDPLHTVFWNNYALINPAVSGLYYKHQAHAQYRNQWGRTSFSPTTVSAGYNAKINAINSGLGFTYMHDDIGLSKAHRVNLNYSYHIQLGEKSTLAAGVSAGVVNMLTESYWYTPTDPVTIDQSLANKKNRGTAFVMNLGLVFKRENLNVGISSTQLNQPTIKGVNYTAARHYYLFADYLFELSSDFSLKPQFLLRTDAVKVSADINLLATYKKQFWLGATYRTNNTFAFMAGWDIMEKFRVGYAYDLTKSMLNNSNYFASHEIVLGFMLK